MAGSQRFIRFNSGSTMPMATRREQKRHRQPQTVEREQERRLATVLLRGDGQNAGQDRPDAGRPSGGEGHPDERGRPERAPLVLQVESRVHHQPGDADHSHHVQAEDDHQHAADLRDEHPVGVERAADCAGAQSKSDEDEAESGDEGHGVSDRLQSRRRPRLRFEVL